MATVVGGGQRRMASLEPDLYERVLAYASLVMLAAIAAALVRGRDHLHIVPPAVWVHLATIGLALALTPPILLGRRGGRRHRLLGRTWAVAMLATALASFAIRQIGDGGFSFIHLLSIWTVAMVPLLWWTARTHQVARHRGMVRGFVTGALLVAGAFTFGFDRMLGRWLFA